jgi:alpha-1,6-mannosyltransferase
LPSLRSRIYVTGGIILASTVVLTVTRAPLGSPIFYAVTIACAVAYVFALRRVWNEGDAPRRLLFTAFALAVAFRAPLMLPKVGTDNDMMRYVWDGRIQRLGFSPYSVLPADPALAWTHNEETGEMPSRRARTPYPPAAQLFFRLVNGIHDSARAMKAALVMCDLLTMIVLWRWLVVTRRNEWLTLAYAWNPLVILEVAHSGHIDALGALWITASAYWLARRRTALASIGFVLAVATKLLPIVLAPLFWRRIRLRDGLVAAALFVLLYLPFTLSQVNPGTPDTSAPLGAVPNVVAHIRFNGPLFRMFAAVSTPQAAAGIAVALGLAVAAWARWKLSASDPAAWAWPMAVALACAPVIYPWYLLYLTPFLFSVATLPLMVWTLAATLAYVVWYVPEYRKPWVVPPVVMLIEYGSVAIAAVTTFMRRTLGSGRA